MKPHSDTRSNAKNAYTSHPSILLALFLLVSGVCYLCLKYQLHLSGINRKIMETQFNELLRQNRELDWQIESLTSRASLLRKTVAATTLTEKIPEADIVHIKLLSLSSADEGNLTNPSLEPRTSSVRSVSHSSGSPAP